MFFAFSFVIAQAFLSLYAVSADCVINCYVIGNAIRKDKRCDVDIWCPEPMLSLIDQLDKAAKIKELAEKPDDGGDEEEGEGHED